MTEKPTYEELQQRIALLEKELTLQKRFEEINRSLFKISDAVKMTYSLDELFRAIHHALSPIIDTTNFFIALYDKTKDSVTFPYCVDTVDDCYPPVIEVSKTESLTAEVIRTGLPVLLTKSDILAKRAKTRFQIPACTPSEVWLGVPLKTRDEIIGVMAVQSYRDAMYYDKTDMEVMVSVADQVATAIERKKAEESLRDSEERFRQVYNHMSIGVAKVSLEFKIESANPAYCKMLGYHEEELIGKHLREITHADVLEENLAKQSQLAAGKIDYFRLEKRFIHKNSDIVHGILDASLVRDGDGKPFYFLGSVSDITDRKQAEQKLKESEERFRNLMENIDAVAVQGYGPDGTTQYWNKASERLYGYTQQEAIGCNLLDLIIPSEIKDDVAKAMREMVASGQPIPSGELLLMHKDGSRVPVMSHHAIVRMPGREQELFCLDVDITERKRAEAEKEKLQTQLLQAQKMESVGRLAGGVAHDFNNMLGVILGYLEFALEKTQQDSDLHADLKEIQSAALRSTEITKQLLAFARKQTISPKQLDLNDTVESMLNMLRRLIGENIDLLWKPSAHLWPVKMDPAQLDQILANLCVNARDAISGAGKLIIETGKKTFDNQYCKHHSGFTPGDFALLTVSDTGSGMHKKILDNLFEPFFTTKEVGQGTGLGLSTIYGIVKQNNGFINVYSEPGQGSTFKIYLPRFFADENINKTVHKKKAVASGTETILLVEDEPSILRMTRMMLERNGYTVLPAATPSKAVEKAKNHFGAIDLLMTDVVMPEMNGRDLAEQITTLYPDIKLLFMSGYTADVIAHQGVLDEGVVFIQKPFSTADLTEKVRELLDMAPDKNQG